jgi:hypothetical protein
LNSIIGSPSATTSRRGVVNCGLRMRCGASF